MSHPSPRPAKPAFAANLAASNRVLRGSLKSVTEDADEVASPSNPVDASVRELRRMVDRDGPLAPERAVAAVRRMGRELAAFQAAGMCRDTRSHVYWLGAVLFSALTGRAPLQAATNVVDQSSTLKPSTFAPFDIPAALDVLVQSCLAPNREQRFGSLIELNAALTALPYPEEQADRFDSYADDGMDRDTPPPVSGVSRREITHRRARAERLLRAV